MPIVNSPKTLAAFPSDSEEGVYVFPFGLTWDPAILDPETLNYDLQIDTAQTFSSPNAKNLTKTSASLVDFQEGTGIGKAFVVSMPKRSTSDILWYWRLRINDGVNVSLWSDIRQFTVPTNNARSQAQAIFDTLADENSYAKEANSSNVYKLILQVGRELDTFLLEKDRAISDLFLDGARDTALLNNFSKYLNLSRSGLDVAAHHRWKTYSLWKAFTNLPGTLQGMYNAVSAFTGEPPTVSDLTTAQGWILPFYFINVPDHPEIKPVITLYSRATLGNEFVLIIFNSWNRNYDTSVLEYYINRMRPAHAKIVIKYSTSRHWTLRFNTQTDWQLWTNTNLDTTTNPGTVRLASGQTSGTLLSPVQEIATVSGFDAPYITADTSGQTLTMQYRTSQDGINFSSWVTLLHGVVPDSTISIYPYIQFQLTISRSLVSDPTPIISEFEFRGIRT